MLKVNLNEEKNIVNIKASGSLGELLSDITLLLKVMYDGINEAHKQEFKYCVKKMAEEEIYAKTEEELNELVKIKEEELEKKAERKVERRFD